MPMGSDGAPTDRHGAADRTAMPAGIVADGLDKIMVRGIRLECLIGFSAHEQDHLQPVDVDLVLAVAPRAGASFAGEVGQGPASDEGPFVDYKELKDRLRGGFLGRRYALLEALAEAVAGACLEHEGVRKVRVTAHKPGALTGARDVAVRITRKHA